MHQQTQIDKEEDVPKMSTHLENDNGESEHKHKHKHISSIDILKMELCHLKTNIDNTLARIDKIFEELKECLEIENNQTHAEKHKTNDMKKGNTRTRYDRNVAIVRGRRFETETFESNEHVQKNPEHFPFEETNKMKTDHKVIENGERIKHVDVPKSGCANKTPEHVVGSQNDGCDFFMPKERTYVKTNRKPQMFTSTPKDTETKKSDCAKVVEIKTINMNDVFKH